MESKKTEKLVTALYLLTSFFDDKEPMKWRLRQLGGKLIGQRENKPLVLEIMGLMTVAKSAGLMSEMNYSIVHKEFSMLVSQDESLGEIFKRVESREEHKYLASAPKPEAKPEERERRPVFYASSSSPQPVVVKDKITKEPSEPGVVALKKNSRQSIILSLLKKKKEIMIKDVSPLIEGVSEKTIQRELLAMVQAGILRKEGEKRWSRYTLAE